MKQPGIVVQVSCLHAVLAADDLFVGEWCSPGSFAPQGRVSHQHTSPLRTAEVLGRNNVRLAASQGKRGKDRRRDHQAAPVSFSCLSTARLVDMESAGQAPQDARFCAWMPAVVRCTIASGLGRRLGRTQSPQSEARPL